MNTDKITHISLAYLLHTDYLLADKFSVVPGKGTQERAKSFLGDFNYIPMEITSRILRYFIASGNDTSNEGFPLMLTCHDMFDCLSYQWKVLNTALRMTIAMEVSNPNWPNAFLCYNKLLNHRFDVSQDLLVSWITHLASIKSEIKSLNGPIYKGVHGEALDLIKTNDSVIEMSLTVVNSMLNNCKDDDNINLIFFRQLADEFYKKQYLTNELVLQSDLIQDLCSKLKSADIQLILEACNWLIWPAPQVLIASNDEIIQTLINVLQTECVINNEEILNTGYSALKSFMQCSFIPKECVLLIQSFAKEKIVQKQIPHNLELILKEILSQNVNFLCEEIRIDQVDKILFWANQLREKNEAPQRVVEICLACLQIPGITNTENSRFRLRSFYYLGISYYSLGEDLKAKETFETFLTTLNSLLTTLGPSGLDLMAVEERIGLVECALYVDRISILLAECKQRILLKNIQA